MPSLNLSLLKETYCICCLPAGEPVKPPPAGSFSLLVYSVEETTLVCPPDQAPPGAEMNAGWRCFRIVVSTDLSVPGILASVLEPLAKAGIGIFATSTFSTDYVLVKAGDVERAVETLQAAGHHIRP
ncbi:MAG: ACT domain-containing protein [Pseudomonadota bacterium]|nr:ACT domain-containing protein [Pseudomonadota bacterium]